MKAFIWALNEQGNRRGSGTDNGCVSEEYGSLRMFERYAVPAAKERLNADNVQADIYTSDFASRCYGEPDISKTY